MGNIYGFFYLNLNLEKRSAFCKQFSEHGKYNWFVSHYVASNLYLASKSINNAITGASSGGTGKYTDPSWRNYWSGCTKNGQCNKFKGSNIKHPVNEKFNKKLGISNCFLNCFVKYFLIYDSDLSDSIYSSVVYLKICFASRTKLQPTSVFLSLFSFCLRCDINSFIFILSNMLCTPLS